jgi:hypothetical protein
MASTCYYCRIAPTIARSHVVPKFVGKYIKANSPFGHMLNLWSNKPELDLHKGPYLCAKCDNETFSGWEKHFSNHVWPDPLNSRVHWTDPATIQFFASLAYRYAIHFLETSPIPGNVPYSTYMRDLAEPVIRDPTLAGSKLFIYPYVHRPIDSGYDLLPGINHLLSLAVHGESFPAEENLPNAMLVIIPKITLLFCDGDLRKFSGCEIKHPVALSVSSRFLPTTSNVDLPNFLKVPLNRCIGKGQAHQKHLGRWKHLPYGTDRRANPTKVCYLAHETDTKLAKWIKLRGRSLRAISAS